MVHVKGTALTGCSLFVTKRFGTSKLEEICEQLTDPDVAKAILRGALRSKWYPFTAYTELLRATDRVCGKGDGALVRPISAHAAELHLNGIYRAFFRVASSSFILRKASQLWRQYYDAGEAVVLVNESRHVVIEVANFPTPDRTHCESIAGWFERTAELTGAKNVVARHDECRGRGGARCVFDVAWS